MIEGPPVRGERMKSGVPTLSTGLPGLDQVVQGLLPGDNIVWQVDSVEDYLPFVAPYCEDALRTGKKLVYFRFARHPELVGEQSGAEIHRLNPEVGFETFTAEIHKVIERAGRGTFYLFDCLSDLAADWYSDLMLGNFFMVTCPYLYELETITYFALFRDCHSFEAVSAIRTTTQLLVDVFRHKGSLYVHPLKVHQRYSPTMYLPHVWDEGGFRPLTESAVLSEVLAQITEERVDAVSRTLDIWDRKFLQAREVLDGVKNGLRPAEEAEGIFPRLLRMMVTRDERVIPLASRYLDLSDLLAIRKRMIGTGLIGGKSVGMLLSRAVLARTNGRWSDRMETHDSFYIGSDVFYTYLVRNGLWQARRDQRNTSSFLDGAEEARRRIQSGTFPSFIRGQFLTVLEYFGQSPIIVRSSSLLEDSFGNAFTGKYESVFCPNQGSPQERLEAFLSAVKTVYASTMSEDALLYRAHRGLLDRDEQMALLVQRVSGAVHGHLFFPQIAGVGLSYNPYAWSEYIEPQAGMLRIVFGLGTRAVERNDDDYTRLVALNAPTRRPEADFGEVVEFAQRRADALDLSANRFVSLNVDEIVQASPDLPIDMFAARKEPTGGRGRTGSAAPPGPSRCVLTFDRLLSATSFVPDMREMLAVLRDAYEYPVDVEFTANFLEDGTYRINLVQCRPLQVKEGGGILPPPRSIPRKDLVLESRGPIIGQSSHAAIDRLVYVVPSVYGEMPIGDRHSVARLIGKITHLEEKGARKSILLLGPGRWGTKMPSLGVPVSFAEIATVSVLCEVVAMGKHVIPNVSLGTHFFNDLVESNMLYLAVFPKGKGSYLNESFFLRSRNRLADLLPEEAEWSRVVRVIDVPGDSDGRKLLLNADSPKQRAVCYFAERR
ncbi:MAG TPA: PEP/pyruvate-binding domain-containing protein [Candidatus Limnocylindrales bacterium]|nr:PEP/pyruvate-binding domain-containing protein [Candidatus Limnocylindrales bacterium]